MGTDAERLGAGIVDMSFVPNRPVAPRKVIILLVGLMLGGITAVGFVSIREFFKVEISSIDKLMKKGVSSSYHHPRHESPY